MKRIGLLGGMSWESSATYYRLVNEGVRDRLGGMHAADLVLRSVDFAPIEALQRAGDWERAGTLLGEEAAALVAQACEVLMLCTNTMHAVLPAIEAGAGARFLHIADATGHAVTAAGHRTVGLLATAYTMEQPFYAGHLREHFGLDVLVPDAADRTDVHRVIYEELVQGRVEPASRERYRAVMARLVERGAEAILLGCTEIDLLVHADDATVPLFDTTALHAARAVELALG